MYLIVAETAVSQFDIDRVVVHAVRDCSVFTGDDNQAAEIEIVKAVVVFKAVAVSRKTNRVSIGDSRNSTQTGTDERTHTVFKESVARRKNRRDGIIRPVVFNYKSLEVVIAAVAGESRVDDAAVCSLLAGDPKTFAQRADPIVIKIVINDFRLDYVICARRSEISDINSALTVG